MAKKYNSEMLLNNQNAKSEGTHIVNVDTCRGCKNKCSNCFARLTSRKGDMFYKPVLVKELKGNPQENIIYRFGNMGDPATSWKNTERLITKKNLLNHCFIVTKLQSIEGFTGAIKNIQVSLDPFNAEHLHTSLVNTWKLLGKFKDLNVVLRIRSCSTRNFTLQTLQSVAVDFANRFNLPVLETRLRFKRKQESIKTYSLIPEHYSYRKGFLRPKKGLKFLREVNRHYVCDLKGKKCAGCLMCTKLFGFKKG